MWQGIIKLFYMYFGIKNHEMNSPHALSSYFVSSGQLIDSLNSQIGHLG